MLWGVQDAANYDFIIEYRLRDDGSIGFRLGATGYNNPFYPPRSTTEAHMHDVLWRIDVDLNGPDGDSAVQFKHIETAAQPLVARDVEEPFNGGRVWPAADRTTLPEAPPSPISTILPRHCSRPDRP